jgi:hypothetical protein
MTDIFGKEEIRMLSFWQPFAGAMLYGKVETRKWSTQYRGLILICSTLTPFEKQPLEVRQTIELSERNESELLLAKTVEKQIGHNVFDLNGYAIAIGRIVSCRRVRITDNTFFKHPPDLYAHIYQDVKRIIPFPIKGYQGLPRLINEETKAKIQIL